MVKAMTSMERLLTTLNHKEPDKVPLFLLLSMYGAKELGMSIQDYFSDPKNVIEAQLRMTKKYSNDCYYAFSYAAVEYEAWGGEVIFSEDGPPNAGSPILYPDTNYDALSPPKIQESKGLLNVLETIEGLKREAGDEVPIIGVVMSPNSLPAMQMGFEHYLDIMMERPEIFDKLMKRNQEFCIQWANAQLSAGATGICYFDPVSSTSIIPKRMYQQKIHQLSKDTISRINGPVAHHFASGSCMPILEELSQTAAVMLGVSSKEDLGEMKQLCKNKQTLLGNLNGIEMCKWSKQEAEEAVMEVIKKAGNGGGLIIADNHGEIPFQVSEDTLLTIGETVNRWGRYPLTWTRGGFDEL